CRCWCRYWCRCWCGCWCGCWCAAGTVGVRGADSLLNELDQGAEAALRVDERDGGTAAAGTRRLVDRRGTRVDHRLEGGGTVVDPVADVMETFPPLLDRLGDRRVGPGRRRELDVAVGD